LVVVSTLTGISCTAQAFNSGWSESGQDCEWVRVLASALSAHKETLCMGTNTVPGEIALVILAGNLPKPRRDHTSTN
jgi:hypothetical protein